MIVAHRPRPITCPSTIEAAKTKNAEEHHPSGAGNDETGGRALSHHRPRATFKGDKANIIGGESINVKDYMSGKYSETHMTCPHCNGYGSSLKESGNTCSRCGGSGLVKRE